MQMMWKFWDFAVRRTVETIKYGTAVASQVGLTINASKITCKMNRKETENATKKNNKIK
jgi:hypothetical protein